MEVKAELWAKSGPEIVEVDAPKHLEADDKLAGVKVEGHRRTVRLEARTENGWGASLWDNPRRGVWLSDYEIDKALAEGQTCLIRGSLCYGPEVTQAITSGMIKVTRGGSPWHRQRMDGLAQKINRLDTVLLVSASGLLAGLVVGGLLL